MKEWWEMSNSIKIDGIAEAIAQSVKQYTAEVAEEIDEEVTRAGKALAKEIKTSNKTPELSSKYKKGWTAKKTKGNSRSTSLVHNKNKPQLTHLLENGHAKVGGGRVAAIPHIKPAWDAIEKEYEENIEKIIKGGGGK